MVSERNVAKAIYVLERHGPATTKELSGVVPWNEDTIYHWLRDACDSEQVERVEKPNTDRGPNPYIYQLQSPSFKEHDFSDTTPAVVPIRDAPPFPKPMQFKRDNFSDTHDDAVSSAGCNECGAKPMDTAVSVEIKGKSFGRTPYRVISCRSCGAKNAMDMNHLSSHRS